MQYLGSFEDIKSSITSQVKKNGRSSRRVDDLREKWTIMREAWWKKANKYGPSKQMKQQRRKTRITSKVDGPKLGLQMSDSG